MGNQFNYIGSLPLAWDTISFIFYIFSILWEPGRLAAVEIQWLKVLMIMDMGTLWKSLLIWPALKASTSSAYEKRHGYRRRDVRN
jgi:hypothetical protein